VRRTLYWSKMINVALDCFDPETLKNAADYLNNYKERLCLDPTIFSKDS
jgi:hypothetical protein